MASLQQFVFISQAKMKTNEEWRVDERMNGEIKMKGLDDEELKSEWENPPNNPKMCLCNYLDFKNHI